MEELEEKVKNTPTYKNCSDIFPLMDKENLLKLTALAGPLMTVAWASEGIRKIEVEFLKVFLRMLVDFEQDQADLVIDLNLYEMIKCPNFKSDLKIKVQYLDKILTRREKEEFIKAMFEISASDQDISKSEEKFINKVNEALKLSSSIFVFSKCSAEQKIEKRKERAQERKTEEIKDTSKKEDENQEDNEDLVVYKGLRSWHT